MHCHVKMYWYNLWSKYCVFTTINVCLEFTYSATPMSRVNLSWNGVVRQYVRNMNRLQPP